MLSAQTKQLNIEIPSELRDHLKKKCKENGSDMRKELLKFVDKYLNNTEETVVFLNKR